MLINGSCTLYKWENNGYNRYFIDNVYWKENKSSQTRNSGTTSQKLTDIYLYDNSVVPETPTKDIFVKGYCNFNFNNSNQETVSQSYNEFRKSNKFVTVLSVANYWYGGLPHYEVNCE